SGISTPGPGIIRGRRSSLRRGLSATRRSADAPQCVHHGHVDQRAILVLVQIEIGDDRPLLRTDVARRDPVERIDVGIRPADIAAAEVGEVASQLVVRRKDVLFDEVSDHTTASWLGAPATGVPVKVEPVVPVRRTVWYSPTDACGRSRRTR